MIDDNAVGPIGLRVAYVLATLYNLIGLNSHYFIQFKPKIN